MMGPKLNVIFCGSLDEETNKSWGKTNNNLLIHLMKHCNIIGRINYEVKNKFVRKIHLLFASLLYGRSTIRDPIIDFVQEKFFLKQFKKIELKPDLIIHSSSLCIPKSIQNICPHILYTDATVIGAIKYNGYSPSIKSLLVFKSETEKYCNRLSKIFTFNNWTKESLTNDFKIEPVKIKNIGFGANLTPYFGEKNYKNGMILIVLRRGLEKNKGLYLLLEAFKEAFTKNPTLSLSVVGTKLDSIEGVTYYENCPREKTLDLFIKASLYAMPALFEPNGMVYIEALACKTPIMGLNRLAFPEFSGEGKYGFVVEETKKSVSDAILNAFSNPELLRQMGKNGQDFVIKRFDWNIVVNKILNKNEYN